MKKKFEISIIKRTGSVICKAMVDKEGETFNSLAERLLATEQYLNNEVTKEIHKKYNVAVRFHL